MLLPGGVGWESGRRCGLETLDVREQSSSPGGVSSVAQRLGRFSVVVLRGPV